MRKYERPRPEWAQNLRPEVWESIQAMMRPRLAEWRAKWRREEEEERRKQQEAEFAKSEATPETAPEPE